MHELALTQSIIEMVAQHAQGQRIRRVTVELGSLSCVMPDALRFCFDIAREGTTSRGGGARHRRNRSPGAMPPLWRGIRPAGTVVVLQLRGK